MLLIDAVNEIARERAISSLKPEHQKRIEAAYTAFVDEDWFAKVATTGEIAAQGFSLSIPLYVKRKGGATTDAWDQTSLRQSWDAWEASAREFWREMDAVVGVLDGLLGREKEAAHG